MIIRVLAISLLLTIIPSCNKGQEKIRLRSGPGKKEMADLNSYFVQKDRERIENYIERKDLKMTEAPSGFWYEIIYKGSGECFKDNDNVVLEYEVKLLDGSRCYSSDELGPKEVIIGKSNIEAGLNQGLKMMRSGDGAIFIIPPFLAYGLSGDGKNIPSRAILIYNITSARMK